MNGGYGASILGRPISATPALKPHSQQEIAFGFQGQLFDSWAKIEWQLYSSVSTRYGHRFSGD